MESFLGSALRVATPAEAASLPWFLVAQFLGAPIYSEINGTEVYNKLSRPMVEALPWDAIFDGVSSTTIGGISSSVFAFIPPQDFGHLSPGLLRGLGDSVLSALSAQRLNAIPVSSFAETTLEQMQRFGRGGLARLEPPRIAAMPWEIFVQQEGGASLVESLSLEVKKVLPWDRILRAMEPEKVGELGPGSLAAIPPQHFRSLQPQKLVFLHPKFLEQIKPDQFANINPAGFKHISTLEIDFFPSKVVSSQLSSAQLKAIPARELTPAFLNELSRERLADVDFESLIFENYPEFLNDLNEKVIEAIPVKVVKIFDGEFITALKPETLGKFTVYQLQSIRQEVMAVASAAQLNAIGFNKFSFLKYKDIPVETLADMPRDFAVLAGKQAETRAYRASRREAKDRERQEFLAERQIDLTRMLQTGDDISEMVEDLSYFELQSLDWGSLVPLLDGGSLNALPPKLLRTLPWGQLWGHFQDGAIASLSPSVVGYIAPRYMQTLPGFVLSLLPSETILAFSKKQWSGLGRAAFAGLRADVLRGLPDSVLATFSAREITALPEESKLAIPIPRWNALPEYELSRLADNKKIPKSIMSKLSFYPGWVESRRTTTTTTTTTTTQPTTTTTVHNTTTTQPTTTTDNGVRVYSFSCKGAQGCRIHHPLL